MVGIIKTSNTQEIQVSNKYNLPEIHKMYMCVCVCVCVCKHWINTDLLNLVIGNKSLFDVIRLHMF
jgi:hypothetical protein